jgi:hypothetical protein
MAEGDAGAFEKRLPEAYRIGRVLAKGAKAIRFV